MPSNFNRCPVASQATADVAVGYLNRGWRPIVVPAGSKNPGRPGWPDEHETLPWDEASVRQRFAAPCNIGVLLGEPSGGLVDVDLDCDEAVLLASEYLPQTSAVFGRASKARSHFIYRVAAPPSNRRCRVGDAGVLVEIRSTGLVTLFPGSTHPSGEPVEWDADGEPAEVDAEALIEAVERLAEAVRRERGERPAAPAVPLGRNGHAVSAVDGRVSRAVQAMLRIGSADNNDGSLRLFAAACRAVEHDLDDDEALRAIRSYETARPFPRRYADDEVLRRIRDAERRVPRGAACPSANAPENLPPVDLWPDPPADEVFHGLVGDIVRTIEPHTEADPVAILGQFLAGFGNLIGRHAHFRAEADIHHSNLFVALVGATAKGRKGTAWANCRHVLVAIDGDWACDRVMSGLSSGEGLVWQVRDPISKREPIRNGGRITGYQEVEVAPGVTDKRLLALEPEFASVLQVVGRSKNTLSSIIRQAWDSGTMRTLTKNNPATATNAHVSVIGHITRDELRRLITDVDLANGLANRFLWLAVRRSKCLPEGSDIQSVNFAPLICRLHSAVALARATGEVTRDGSARDLWREVYPSLSEGKPGLLGAATSRAEAQTMRLAMLYALLDESSVIRREHLSAALALWAYAEASARYIFGGAAEDPVAEAIDRALQDAGERGLTRTEIYRDVFARNVDAARIAAALSSLSAAGKAACARDRGTGGRPAERWFATGVFA